MTHHPRSGQPRRSNERGVVLVEMAFVAIFLVVLVAGVFDYGLAWQSGLAINESARTGARVGSGQSTSPGADYYVLTGIRASLVSSGKIDDVERVVIFKAITADGKVPTNCTANTPSGTCNVLTQAQLKAITNNSFTFTNSWDPEAADSFPQGSGCLKAGSAVLAGWCPSARGNVQLTADYYGVWIKYRHHYQFPLLGSGVDVTRSAVMRLEPKSN